MPHLMRAFAAIALVLLSAAAPAAPAPPPPDITAILEQRLTEGGPPALGMLILRDGRIAGQAVRGVRQAGRDAPVRPDDLWHLGSNGKAITATVIARLVEQRKLSWTTPLDRMLPTLASKMRPEYRKVTLVDLLSHQAGINEPGGDSSDLLITFFKDRRPLPAQRLDWATLALALEPVAPPGTRADYSNTGYIIAAVIAEQATGRSFEQLAAELVFRPLGMKSATFAPARLDRDLVGHLNGAAVGPEESNPPMWGPAGGIRMSLTDWARFCIDHIEGESGRGRLLTAAGYRFLHTPPTREFALGWDVGDAFAGRQGPLLQHTGSDGNWFVAVALFPKTRDGVLIVANAGESMGGDAAVFQAAMAVFPSLSVPTGPKAGAGK